MEMRSSKFAFTVEICPNDGLNNLRTPMTSYDFHLFLICNIDMIRHWLKVMICLNSNFSLLPGVPVERDVRCNVRSKLVSRKLYTFQ